MRAEPKQVLFALVLVLGSAGVAHAQDVEEAQEHFERGIELYEEGGYEAALVEFQRAYELAPNFRLLYNIAQIYFQLNDYAEALRTFERYLREGGGEVTPERRLRVRREIATLRRRVGLLEIETDVEGATVLLDDVPMGTTPTDPITANIGRHVLRVEAPGYHPFTQRVTIASEQTETIDVTLEALESDDPEPVPVDDARGSRRAALWALGLGAALTGAAAGVNFGLAWSADRGLQEKLDQVPADEAGVRADRDRIRRSALAADILGAVALASAAGFVVVLLATSGDEEAAPAAARLELGPGGVALRGRF